MEKMKICVVVFAILSTMSYSKCYGFDFGLPIHTYHLHVVNQLSGNQDLLVHCKSKNNDLGIHHLGIGNEFKWDFRENYWGNTLFWCFVSTEQKHTQFNAFWPEKDHHWLRDRCGKSSRQCSWIVKDDGIYLWNVPGSLLDFVYKWQ